MKNGDMPAMAQSDFISECGLKKYKELTGLTKREDMAMYFAGKYIYEYAGKITTTQRDIAKFAVDMADALLEALEEKE